jgi:hypothetical protein
MAEQTCPPCHEKGIENILSMSRGVVHKPSAIARSSLLSIVKYVVMFVVASPKMFLQQYHEPP